MNRRMKVVAARHALGLADTGELIDAAHALLDDGIYSYSLGELATQYEPTVSDSDRWFKAALRELGIAMAPREESIAILIEDAAMRIIESSESPAKVIADLHSLYVWSGRPDHLAAWNAYHYRIEDAFIYHESFVEVVEPDAALIDDIVQHARMWNRVRWRPVIQPAWRSSTVLALAAGIRDDHAFDRLPILADALQDAGCENEDILGHLRHPAKHDRACWVVELLTEFEESN